MQDPNKSYDFSIDDKCLGGHELSEIFVQGIVFLSANKKWLCVIENVNRVYSMLF